MTKTLKTVVAGAAIMTSVVGQAGTLYVFESDANGFNTKNYFYDTGKEVVAFDSQFTGDIAKRSIEFLRSKTESPITHLVITHPNPDKFNGSSEFAKEGATVIASQLTADNMKPVHDYKKYFFVNIAKMFTEATYPAFREPDETFDDSLELVLSNGEKIVLKELKTSGVSANQTIALIPGLKAVVVGDLVHHQAHAWLEGPIVSGQTRFSTQKWVAALERLTKEIPEDYTVLGGRGLSAGLKVAVEEQIRYLKEAEKVTRAYVDSLPGSNLEEKKKNANYEELANRFEAAFPKYALKYMIQYGAYGLVASLK